MTVGDVDSAALNRCIEQIRIQLDAAERAFNRRIFVASVRHEVLDDGRKLRVVAVGEGSQVWTGETELGRRGDLERQ